jgi:ribosome recycling factor
VPPGNRSVLAFIQRVQSRFEFCDRFVYAGDFSFLHGHEEEGGEDGLESGGDIRAFGLVSPTISHVAIADHATSSTDQQLKLSQFVAREPNESGITNFPGRAREVGTQASLRKKEDEQSISQPPIHRAVILPGLSSTDNRCRPEGHLVCLPIMALDDILLEAEEKMIKTEEVVQKEFAGVRTGKASPGLVENILVDVYGSHMRIRELAGITTPEPRMLLIQPWDATTLHPIEKAIQKSNLGLNPAVDKKFIRIVLPELSQERRQEFVKIVKKMAEEGRVAIRHVRRDAIEALKKDSKSGGVTEDQVEGAEKEAQKLTDQYIGKIDAHLTHKEKEIMTV